MKKIFVIAAVASLVLASCTKAAIEQPDKATAYTGDPEMVIGAFSAPLTKGYIPAGATFSEGVTKYCYRSMQVSGFKVSEKDSGDFFINKTFVKGLPITGGTDSVWVGYPERVYYPLGSSDKYTFLAYSDNNLFKPSWNGAREVSFEVTAEAMTNDIVASAFKAADDQKTASPVNPTVQAKFWHTQAYVTINISAADTATEYAKVTIDDLAFKKIFNIGKLTLTYDPALYTANNKPVIDWNYFGMCQCEKFSQLDGYFAEGQGETTSTNPYGTWASGEKADSIGIARKNALTANTEQKCNWSAAPNAAWRDSAVITRNLPGWTEDESWKKAYTDSTELLEAAKNASDTLAVRAEIAKATAIWNSYVGVWSKVDTLVKTWGDTDTLFREGNFIKNNHSWNVGGYGVPVKLARAFRFETLYPAYQTPTALDIVYTVNGKQMTATWELKNQAANFVWEPGKHYIYNVKIGMYEVKITPEIDTDGNWQEVNLTPDEVIK